MVEEATPSETASPNRVVEGLEVRRDQLLRYATKFRVRWMFLFVACLIKTSVKLGIDVMSNTPSTADWYKKSLATMGLYLMDVVLVRAKIKANLIKINRTLTKGDSNLQSSPIPTSLRREPKPATETNWKDQPL